MLVLSRKVNEGIALRLPSGDAIVLGVAKIRNGTVRLTFAAPASVRILRQELTTGDGATSQAMAPTANGTANGIAYLAHRPAGRRRAMP